MSASSVHTLRPPGLDEKETEFLSTLERGLAVLRVFNMDRPVMRLSEVAEATQLSPAVARRCLYTLERLGYVAKRDRQYMLRPEVLSFGWAYMSSMNLENLVLSHLQVVRDETGDSSSMAVRSGSDILYVAHASTQRPFRVAANVGTKLPIHATSLGRVLLAFQPDEVIDRYFASATLKKFTENTIIREDALRASLQSIKQTGFATAKDELDFGIISVSVPIFDSNRNIKAAINCSTSTTRVVEDDFIGSRLPKLRQAASHIEGALNQVPYIFDSIAN